MFRTVLLLLFFCGLTVLSVVLEYKASAATYECQPLRVCMPAAPLPCNTLPCVPDVTPPDCPRPDCDVERPLLRRSCAHAWRAPLMKTGVRHPQLPCFIFREDKLNAVARVSTLDILRAIGR